VCLRPAQLRKEIGQDHCLARRSAGPSAAVWSGDPMGAIFKRVMTRSIGWPFESGPKVMTTSLVRARPGVAGKGTSNNLVELCYIGTNTSSQTGLGNTNDGVLIDDGASANEVLASFIEYNDNNGVELDSGTSDDTIEDNIIIGNANNGVVDDGTGDSISGNLFFANGSGD
jgi:Right handed beta helix region